MIKGKRAGKTLKEIGKRWYDFDFELERTIYCYLCCVRQNKKKLRKLGEELKFESYQQWKQYIWNKCEIFDKDKLYEFSKYLNQRKRNIKSDHEFWYIMATVLLTFVITKIVDTTLSLQMNFKDIPVIVEVFLLQVFIIFSLMFVMIQTLYPIFNNNIDEKFLKDYKKIIDEIVKEKAK